MRKELSHKFGLVTAAELGDIVGVSEDTLKKWRSRNKGPQFIRLGGHVFYREDDIWQWVNDVEAEGGQKPRFEECEDVSGHYDPGPTGPMGQTEPVGRYDPKVIEAISCLPYNTDLARRIK